MNELQYWQAAGIAKTIEYRDGYAEVETDKGFYSVGLEDIDSIGAFRLDTVGDQDVFVAYLRLRHGAADVAKVRRRVEDAIRKGDLYALALAAVAAGVKIE